MKRRKSAGFTLVEIMIVVAIIGLLAAIAIPSFVRARTSSQRNTCINNLRQIDQGKEMYKTATWTIDPTDMLDLVPNFIKRTPVCPANGTYALNAMGVDPTCTLGATLQHEL